MPDQDKVKILYDAVSKDYDIGSYDEFSNKLQDSAKQEAFFNGVGKQYNLGTIDEFRSKVSRPKSAAIKSQPQSAIPGIPQESYNQYQQSQESPVLANPKVKVTPAPKVKPQTEAALPDMKYKKDSWAHAVFGNHYSRKAISGITSAIAGGFRMANELNPDKVHAGVGNELADFEQFNASTNIANSRDNAHAAFNYLKDKGVNPNDQAQINDYLKNNHSDNDKKVLDYFGGEDFLKSEESNEFKWDEAKQGKNLLGNTAKAMGNLATILPLSVTGGFMLDGYNHVVDDLNNNPNAKNLSGNQKQILGLIGGGINQLAGHLKLPFGKSVVEKVIPALTKKAVQQLVATGEKEITATALNAAVKSTFESFKNAAKRTGVAALKDLLHNEAVGATMATGNALNQKLANEMSGDEVYNVNFDDYLSQLGATAGEFGLATLGGSLVKAPFELIPKSQRNYVQEKVTAASTPEDIQFLKNDIALQSKEMGMTPEQVENALKTVDAYAEIKTKLPEGIGAKKTNEVLGLMAQRNQLKSQLSDLTQKRDAADDLFKSDVDKEISTAQINLESMEDKIKSTVNGNNLKFTEKDGQYFKDTGEGPVAISKDRYEFEQLMADKDKTTEEKAVNAATNEIDKIITTNEQDQTPPVTKPTADTGNDAGRVSETPGQPELDATHKASDSDGLIRKALKAQPGETIEVNGQLFKVAESERSKNRQSGTARLIHMVDGKDSDIVEITQKSDARNADRLYDNQNEVKTATRLADGRYSFGQGIRASSNIEGLLELLKPKENEQKATENKQAGQNTAKETTVGSSEVTAKENPIRLNDETFVQPKPQIEYEAGSWSEKFNSVGDGKEREDLLSSEVDKSVEVIKQLKASDKVNLKADAVLKRIKELADNKLISRELAEEATDVIDNYRNEKVNHLLENGEKKKTSRESVTDPLPETENPEELSNSLSEEMEQLGAPEDGVIDRAIAWVDNTIGDEKAKRGKKSENTYSTVIPPAIGREIGIGALKAMRATLLATKSLTQAFKAAIDHGKKEGLGTKELEEMRKWMHGVFAGIKSEHITDFVKENKIERKQAEQLKKSLFAFRERSKEFIKDAQKEKDWNNAKKLVSDVVKDLQSYYKGKNLPFSKADIAKITKIATGATKPNDVIRIINSLETIFGKAENNKLVSDTDNLAKKVSKIVRNDKTSAAESEVFRRINNIKAKNLTDANGDYDYKAIGRLNKALAEITESHKDVNIGKVEGSQGPANTYELTNETKANHDYLNTLAEELEQVQDAHIERKETQQAEDIYNEFVDNGTVDESKLSAQEIKDLKQAIKDGTLPELVKLRENEKLADLAEKLDKHENKSAILKDDVARLEEEAKVAIDPVSIKTIAAKKLFNLINGRIKTDELSNSELVRLHRVLSRIAENGDLTSAGDLLKLIPREHALTELRETVKGNTSNLSNFWANKVHLPHMLAKVVPNEKLLAKFLKATGLQEWDAGYNLARNEAGHVSEEALKLIGKASGSDEGSLKAGYGSLRRGVISYLMQHYGGSPEEINSHFNDVSRANLDRTIEYLRESSGDEEFTKTADFLSSIKGELLDGVTDYESFIQKVNSAYGGDKEVIQHWIDSFAKHTEELADSELLFKGNQMDTGIENYTSTRVRDAGERQRNEISSLIDDSRTPSTVGKKSSGATITRERGPIKKGYLDFDFDSVQPSRFMENQLQIHTLADRYKMQSLFDDPRFAQEVFPDSKESMSLFYDRILNTEQARRGVNTQLNSKGGKIASRVIDGLQSFSAFFRLGSVLQPMKQVPSVAVNTAINLGTDAGLIVRGMSEAFGGSAKEFLKQSATSLRHENKVTSTSTQQAAERGNDLGRLNRVIISELNKHGVSVLPVDIRTQIMTSVMSPLGMSDQYVAEASYLAYYLKNIKDQGGDISNIDWANEAQNPNREAQAYAEHMVDKTQNISDKSKAATWLQPKGTRDKATAFILSPFSSFNLNQKMRSAGDFNKMLYGKDGETRLQGARDFGATVAESLVFNLIKAYGIKYIGLGAALGLSTLAGGRNNDEEKSEISDVGMDGLEPAIGNSVQDVLFSGLPIAALSDGLSYATNQIYTGIAGQEPYISGSGKVAMRDRQPLMTNWKGGNTTPTDKMKSALGGFSALPELILRDGERISMLKNGEKEVKNEITGKTQTVPLTDFEKNINKLSLIKDILSIGAGIGDADLGDRPLERDYNKAMADLKIGYTEGIKRMVLARNYFDSKYKPGNLGADTKETLENIQEVDNTPKGQRLKKDFQYLKDNRVEIEKLLAINSALVATGKISKEYRNTFEREGKLLLKAMNSGEQYQLSEQTKDAFIDIIKSLSAQNIPTSTEKQLDAGELQKAKAHEEVNQ